MSEDGIGPALWIGIAIGLGLGFSAGILYIDTYADALCRSRGYSRGEYNPFFAAPDRVRCAHIEALR